MKLSKRELLLLGQWLADCRRAADLSQQKVARLNGYTSNQYLSNIERGLSSPSAKFLHKAIELYKIPPKTMAKVLSGYYFEVITREFL